MCCVISFILHDINSWISTEIADDLALVWYQDIDNHQDSGGDLNDIVQRM